MLDFPIDAHRIAEALEDISRILFRIEIVLTRLAPPIPDNPAPRRAELSDYRRVDPDTVQSINQAMNQTARNLNIEPNSDKMFEYMREYEDRMESILGPESTHLINELPWNKAAGGRIFRKETTQEASQETTSSEAV